MKSTFEKRSPRTAFVEILYGCSLSCSYCYVGRSLNHEKPIVPPLETTLKILSTIKNQGVKEIVLLGGEPLMHPNLCAICTRIAELEFAHRGIVTSGIRITKKASELLKMTGFWVDITFRGRDTQTFDAIARQQGARDAAVRAVQALADAGVPIGIEFDCVPDNFDGLYGTIEQLVLSGFKLKQVQLHRILPRGDAEGQMDKFSLSLEQWGKVFDQAGRIRADLGIPVVFEDGFPFCLVDPKFWDMITPCACGFTLLTIGPTGDARYCSCHNEILGNVLSDSMTDIWGGKLEAYRLPDRHPRACLACDLLDVCRGGCSASSGKELNKGVDVFHERFTPIKLGVKPAPQPIWICGQAVLGSRQ